MKIKINLEGYTAEEAENIVKSIRDNFFKEEASIDTTIDQPICGTMLKHEKSNGRLVGSTHPFIQPILHWEDD